MTDDATYRKMKQRAEIAEARLQTVKQETAMENIEELKMLAKSCKDMQTERDLALAECERLKALINKALDDLDAEAGALDSLDNAHRNFSSTGAEHQAYAIAMVRASKSSRALRDAARAKP